MRCDASGSASCGGLGLSPLAEVATSRRRLITAKGDRDRFRESGFQDSGSGERAYSACEGPCAHALRLRQSTGRVVRVLGTESRSGHPFMSRDGRGDLVDITLRCGQKERMFAKWLEPDRPLAASGNVSLTQMQLLMFAEGERLADALRNRASGTNLMGRVRIMPLARGFPRNRPGHDSSRAQVPDPPLDHVDESKALVGRLGKESFGSRPTPQPGKTRDGLPRRVDRPGTLDRSVDALADFPTPRTRCQVEPKRKFGIGLGSSKQEAAT